MPYTNEYTPATISEYGHGITPPQRTYVEPPTAPPPRWLEWPEVCHAYGWPESGPASEAFRILAERCGLPAAVQHTRVPTRPGMGAARVVFVRSTADVDRWVADLAECVRTIGLVANGNGRPR